MYIFMYIITCYDVKDVHYSFSTKICCSRNAQICNKIDALKGSSDTASATALFYLEKGESLYPKRRFLDILSIWSKNFPGDFDSGKWTPTSS